MNLIDVSQSKKRAQQNPQLVPLELLAVKPGQLFSAGTQYADQVCSSEALPAALVLPVALQAPPTYIYAWRDVAASAHAPRLLRLRWHCAQDCRRALLARRR